ncbi:MAG: DUF45 domain-containing protein [Bacteroidaceae bacterium]|nr:DUF45 domain-containing protein [Bacteroidaceae bacterium]
MNIQITRKRVKRMTLRVTSRGEVHVSVPLGLPQADVEAFISANEAWLARALARTELRQQQRAQFYDQLHCTTRAEWHDCLERLKSKVEPMVAHYEPRMGVQHASIVYKKLTSKWGSCHVRTRQLTFSLYLLLLPDWCIEHIVVHELAHLLVPNHSAAFYRVMDKHFPRWKEARAVTRQLQAQAK